MLQLLIKGHSHDVSAYLRESVNSVGVVKSTCTLCAVQLKYQTVEFKIDYTHTKTYPDPNVVTVALYTCMATSCLINCYGVGLGLKQELF